MDIVVNEDDYVTLGMIKPQTYRTILRRPDHSGIFKRLQMELEAFAKQYSRSIDDVQEIYGEVNCDKTKLEGVLRGQSFTKWDELDDICLKKGDCLSRPYRFLIKEKGAEEIERRKIFLGLKKAVA